MAADPIRAASPASVLPPHIEPPARPVSGLVDESAACIQAAADSVDARLEREIIEINKAIQGLVQDEKKAKNRILWLQIAAAVVAIAVPILAMVLAWWVALPVLAIGVALFGLSWYFGSQYARIHNEISVKDGQKIQLENNQLKQDLLRLASRRVSSPEMIRLSEDPQKAHRELREGLSRVLEPYFEKRRAMAEYAALDLAGGEKIGAGSFKTRQDEKETLQRRREICSLTAIIKKKQESLLREAKTTFVLQIAGYVALAVAPILGLSVAPFAALPFLAVGFGSYFSAWHFAERRDGDRRDLEVHERERVRKSVLVKAEQTYDAESQESSTENLFKHVERKRASIEALDLASGPHNRVSFWVNNLAPEKVYFPRPAAS